MTLISFPCFSQGFALFLILPRRLSHSRRLSRASKASIFEDEDDDGGDQDDSQCPERPVTEAHMVAFFGAIGKNPLLHVSGLEISLKMCQVG